MSSRFVVQPGREQAGVAAALEVLGQGGIVAYPTDTLYGLAADPRNSDAVERLFGIKGRAPDQPVPLIAAGLDQVLEIVEGISPPGRRLAERFWPGPLSLILRAGPRVAAAVTGGTGTVAVRVPAHPFARAIAAALGFGVTATSANLSGEPPAASADEVAARLRDRIDLVLDAGPSPGGPPSTIVDVVTGAPRLVRAGVVSWDRVLESLQ